MERLPYQVARWVSGPDFDPARFEGEVDALCVEDRDQNPIALFKSEWNLNYAAGRHPSWTWSPAARVAPLSKRRYLRPAPVPRRRALPTFTDVKSRNLAIVF